MAGNPLLSDRLVDFLLFDVLDRMSPPACESDYGCAILMGDLNEDFATTSVPPYQRTTTVVRLEMRSINGTTLRWTLAASRFLSRSLR